MRKIGQTALVFFVLAAFVGTSFATTWFPQEFTCPVDGQKNTFQVVGSYGTYIYMWPSKYQWLFWPQTDSQTFYICSKCHLTAFMWDFDKLPKEKLPEIRKILEGVKVSKAFKDYNEIPVTERLEIIEKIYKVLDKGDEWWESFYRLKGYHFGKEGNSVKAAESRRKSLEMTGKRLDDPKSGTPKKLLLYISAAMKHFLEDDPGALEDLQKALDTKYESKTEKPEDVANAENGMNERIRDYIARIKSEKDKPRLFDKYSTDEH
jgi:hypothetical protein